LIWLKLSLSEIWEKGYPIGQRGTELLTEIDALIDEARLDEALQKTNEAIFKYPSEINFPLKLSQIYSAKLDFKSAIKANIRALRMMPDYSDLYFNLVIILLKMQKYKMGIRCYLDVFERTSDGCVGNQNSTDFWHGECLDGKTLLILSNDGIGDLINFFPVIDRLLKLYDCTIHYQCLSPLQSILENSYQHERLIYHANGDVIRKTDYFSTLVSVYFLWILKANIIWEEVSWHTPYIKPTLESRTFWASKIEKNNQLKIGLCWVGANINNNDQNRSLLLKDLAEYLKGIGDNVTFYALGIKKDVHWEEGADTLPIAFIDHRDHVKTVSDSAAMIEQMDLVISICTAEAHIAGALGKDTIALLPYYHCWRWPMTGERTGFYRSVTLLRQKAFKDWSGVLKDLRIKVLEKING
jgi:tetratricopeptide (TPR) repeat protein